MGRKILLAEDDRSVSKMLEIGLQRAGYEVIVARDGLEAVSAAKSSAPDLIILDVNMPKLNGYEVARMLKFDQKYAAIPILMLTARKEPKDRDLGLKTGADRYVNKPVAFDRLLAIVGELLSSPKAPGTPGPPDPAPPASPVASATPPARRGRTVMRHPIEPSQTFGDERRIRFGKYELIREIGRGGMAVVYLARDPSTDRRVAVKTLSLTDSGNAELVQRLRIEVATVAALDHPRIVPIVGTGVIDGTPYFAMPYIEGRTLSEVLESGGLPTLGERVAILRMVADAVAHAHEQRVVHRDLKTSNVILDGEGQAWVMDFGIAKHLDQARRLTLTGEVLGTPEYMAPEQMADERGKIGPATDVYALGVMLYELISGDVPYPGLSLVQVVARTLAGVAPPPTWKGAPVDPELAAICACALSPDTANRYPTAREMTADLDRYLDREGPAR